LDELLKLLEAVNNMDIDYVCHQANKEAEEIRKDAESNYTYLLEHVLRLVYSELKIHDIYQKEKN